MGSINQYIVDYVRNALQQGHDLDSIRQFLIKNNASISDVDEAINMFKNVKSVNTNPIDTQLKNFIKNQLATGHKLEEIKTNLLSHGYSKDLINKAINDSKPSSLKYYILLIIIVLAIGIYAFVTMNKDTNSNIQITIDKNSYYAGDNINYVLESDSNINNVRIVIKDFDTIHKSNSQNVDAKLFNGQISLPTTLSPGTYSIVVIYGEKESSKEFIITENNLPNNPNTNIPNSPIDSGNDNQNNDNTNTQPNNPNTNIPNSPTTPTNIRPPTAPGARTFGQTMTIISGQAKSNPTLAVNNCNKFTSQIQSDICLGTVASISNRLNICDSIENSSVKDNCYTGFIIKGSKVNCGLIKDISTKEYCEQVDIVNQMNYYYQQKQPEKVLELNKKFKPPIYNSNPTVQNYDANYNEQSSISATDFNYECTNCTG